jgi:predicted AlkP superfamily phosphohydrolase/phosphomutase
MYRTLLIGLDGATFKVLDSLMNDGVMPFLKEFLARGVRADLLSTPNALTPPAWTSLVTGRTPGHHGIFDFVHAEEGAEGLYFTLNMSYDIRCETIWSIVSREGGSVTSLNFPVSYPPWPVNGYIVPGFTHWKHLRRSIHPPEFYETLKMIPGFDARALSMDMNQELKSIQYLPPEEYLGWIEHHIKREAQWFNISRHILEHSPTDLLAVLFDGVDKLQHLCWRFIDPEIFPSHPDPAESMIHERCLDYFRQLDGFIRELVQLAGPQARIFLASDHGFGATSEVFYANVWLEREGYLRWTEEAAKDAAGFMSADRIKSHVVGIDWKHTSAYALTPSSNGIYIRRADGATGDGHRAVASEQYEAFRRELADRLLAFRHPVTGRQLIKRVMTREEAFPGDANSRAPDLTLVLEDYGFLSVLNADEVVKRRPEEAGTHNPLGVFMAGGEGIEGPQALSQLEIIDVAPTLLHSLGMTIPEDMEGRVVTECYQREALARMPLEYAGAATAAAAQLETRAAEEPVKMDEDEQEKLFAKLKLLGYME